MAIQISGSTVIHDSQDVQVSGVVTATSFHGDASQLTNLPAAGSSLEATASGTLADGSTVIVNSDGTVSVVAQTGSASPSAGSEVTYNSAAATYNSAVYDSSNGKVVISYRDQTSLLYYGYAVVGTVSGTSISFGTPVVFESASIYYTSIAYDSTNQKVIIAYSDNGNNQYGTAIVGTVSGTSISFGSPVVFESARSDEMKVVYDSSNNKVVIAYQDHGNSAYGTAIVGTVSGTSISFGSPVVFESAVPGYISPVYDSANGKVVISYYDFGNSRYGTAIVGTVSGTSISFGSPVVFNTAATFWVASTFDSTNNKVVIAYRDNGNSDYGTAIVGTVSGTSISFGSESVFESSRTNNISATFDSFNGKVVIAYNDYWDSEYGKAVVGTVSGTSISFGSPVVYNSGGSTYNVTITFDSTNNRSVIAYRDQANSQYGTAAVFATNTLSTNLTSENYIGISNGAYSDGQTATIQLIGSVDDAQSSLTPGQKYYVQTDGTLSTTAGFPSVLAGKAISSTKLAIKG